MLVSAPGRPSSLPGVMPVDPGFYGDLAGRLYGLLIGLEDRLDCDDAAIIHQFTGSRHYGLARRRHYCWPRLQSACSSGFSRRGADLCYSG